MLFDCEHVLHEDCTYKSQITYTHNSNSENNTNSTDVRLCSYCIFDYIVHDKPFEIIMKYNQKIYNKDLADQKITCDKIFQQPNYRPEKPKQINTANNQHQSIEKMMAFDDYFQEKSKLQDKMVGGFERIQEIKPKKTFDINFEEIDYDYFNV